MTDPTPPRDPAGWAERLWRAKCRVRGATRIRPEPDTLRDTFRDSVRPVCDPVRGRLDACVRGRVRC
jgi:hypothetical protein